MTEKISEIPTAVAALSGNERLEVYDPDQPGVDLYATTALFLALVAATYDPTGVDGDAFDMANMAEAADAKVMTSAERTKLAFLTVTASANIDGIRTLANGAVQASSKATAANIRAGAADKYVTADGVESAAELVTLTDAATVALDWSAFLTGQVTLGGNRTLGNPANGEPGTWRTLIVTQDATGSRTLAFGAQYKFAGGTAPTPTPTAGATDVLSILCVTATEFFVFSALDMA